MFRWAAQIPSTNATAINNINMKGLMKHMNIFLGLQCTVSDRSATNLWAITQPHRVGVASRPN
jgi:hypothetical protein